MATDTDDEWDPPSDAEDQFFEDSYSPEAMQTADAQKISGVRPNIETDTERASVRVFGVPELLEHILLFVADAVVQDTTPSSHPHLEPAQTLTGLTRVNSDFYHSLKSSKLARLLRSWEHEDQTELIARGEFMQTCHLVDVDNQEVAVRQFDPSSIEGILTARLRPDEAKPKHVHCPVFWLLQHLIHKKKLGYRVGEAEGEYSDADYTSRIIHTPGLQVMHYNTHGSYYSTAIPANAPSRRWTRTIIGLPDTPTVAPETIEIYIPLLDLKDKTSRGPKPKLTTFLSEKMASEKASWRGIKATDGEKLAICFADIIMPHCKGRLRYKQRLEFEKDATLGEVFDKYYGLVERSKKEHLEAS